MVKDQENVPEEVKTKIQSISKKMDEIGEILKTGRRSLQSEVGGLGRQLQASSSAPTQSQLRKKKHLLIKVEEGIEKINDLITVEFPDLQSQLDKSGIRPVIPKPIKPPKYYKDR